MSVNPALVVLAALSWTCSSSYVFYVDWNRFFIIFVYFQWTSFVLSWVHVLFSRHCPGTPLDVLSLIDFAVNGFSKLGSRHIDLLSSSSMMERCGAPRKLQSFCFLSLSIAFSLCIGKADGALWLEAVIQGFLRLHHEKHEQCFAEHVWKA